MPEFDKKITECFICKKQIECTLLKPAHVPLMGWICDDCREEWVSE